MTRQFQWKAFAISSGLLVWSGIGEFTAQSPQGWLGLSTSQNLPKGWEWSMEGQLRNASGQARWNEGILDAGVRRSIKAIDGLSLDGQWRTGWEWPYGGGWTTSWRWATSLIWAHDVGDHKVALRVRHQFGGSWMQAWDRSRWRVQCKWTHDLPNGWKLQPAYETFLGAPWTLQEEGGFIRPTAMRGRLVVDKKLDKRRHMSFGYQWQAPMIAEAADVEHTLLLTFDLTMKKVKKRKKSSSES